MKPSLSRTIDS